MEINDPEHAQGDPHRPLCPPCQTALLGKSKRFHLSLSDWYRELFVYQETEVGFVHHETLESLRSAVQTHKCMLCCRFWNSLSPKVKRAILGDVEVEHRSWVPTHTTKMSVRPSWHSSMISMIARRFFGATWPWELEIQVSHGFSQVDEDYYRTLHSFVYAKHSSVVKPFCKKLDINTTAFPATQPLASQWLERCCSQHETCNDDYGRNNWNPSRLLDLNSYQDATIRLVDGTSLVQPVTYVTLSHRWGSKTFIKLTKETERQLRAGFSITKIPLTFRHAAQVTYALGYRYLWIDCLCIRQDPDDSSDWNRESSLMHKVYRHGHFNISATCARDCDDGLFRDRGEAAEGFTDVKVRPPGLFGRVTSCVAIDEEFWEENVSNALLNQRGWVFQERVLSKRVLHFGKSQLSWECRELNASESFPVGLLHPSSHRGSIKRLQPQPRKLLELKRRSQKDREWVYSAWGLIVSHYSPCELTFEGDKLVAIMGVAKQLNDLIQDTYLAGMWKSNLVAELTWSVYGPSRRPLKYRAPSWSWASIDAHVTPGSRIGDLDRVEIQDVFLEYATEDRFGMITGGRLTLAGILRPVTIHRRSRKWGVHLLDMESDYHDLEKYTEFQATPDNIPADEFEHENENGTLFYLEILAINNRGPLTGLLLRSEDKTTGTFSRLGHCVAWAQLAVKLMADRKRFPDLPCVSWDPKRGLHTIHII